MPTDFFVQFHDEASAEYDAAFDWYLDRSPDATLKFDAEIARSRRSQSHRSVGLPALISLADFCSDAFPLF
jgi:plasmid stabilization system protein ParE